MGITRTAVAAVTLENGMITSIHAVTTERHVTRTDIPPSSTLEETYQYNKATGTYSFSRTQNWDRTGPNLADGMPLNKAEDDAMRYPEPTRKETRQGNYLSARATLTDMLGNMDPAHSTITVTGTDMAGKPCNKEVSVSDMSKVIDYTETALAAQAVMNNYANTDRNPVDNTQVNKPTRLR